MSDVVVLDGSSWEGLDMEHDAVALGVQLVEYREGCVSQ